MPLYLYQNECHPRYIDRPSMCASQKELSESTCEEILSSFADGDISSFEVLYHRHKYPIKQFIYNRTKDCAATDDITQVVWERIIQSSARIKEEYLDKSGSFLFKPYLYRVAQNLITDLWRSKGHAQNTQYCDEDSSTDITDSESISAPDMIAIEQMSNCIESKLGRFKQSFIDAFYLTRDGHLTYAEAASALEVNLETLRSRVKSVLLGIKPCLESYKSE